MKEDAAKICRRLLDSGEVDGVLGLEMAGNIPTPKIFAKGDDLDRFEVEPVFPVVTLLRNIWPFTGKERIALVVRGCHELAIKELAKREMIDLRRIHMVGLACSEEQAKTCRCLRPYPTKTDIGTKVRGVEDELAKSLRKMSLEERGRFWEEQFKKCNKCYGCSENCPVCVCEDCALEDCAFVRTEGIPPSKAFHIIRAYHVADKCIECGECERSCPVAIPLRSLQRMLAEDIKELFGYQAGMDDRQSPVVTTLEDAPLKEESE
jgi:ferredoxin